VPLHLGILGTGLIGASLGQGVRQAGGRVLGWDPSPAAAQIALDVGALDAIAADEASVWESDLDLIALAGPPSAVREAARLLDVDTLTIDVAGVKGPICAAVPEGRRFIGTHPMAGRETSGPAAASPALFRGAAWVICPQNAAADDIRRVETLITSLGARPVSMTPAEHDEAVAMVSHLPQLLAAALVTEATDHTAALDLAAGSFRDLTRVAASDPLAWVELLRANAPALRSVVADLGVHLSRVVTALDADGDELLEYLTAAQSSRRELAPPVVAVRVALADEPGEIARVGRALEASAVDLRDLQLRHAPHGGGGLLTLSVRPGEVEPLRSALESRGLILAN
jgi:prephenate dehydrogenase